MAAKKKATKKSAKKTAKKKSKKKITPRGRLLRSRYGDDPKEVRLVSLANPESAEKKINDLLKAGWSWRGPITERGITVMLVRFDDLDEPEPAGP